MASTPKHHWPTWVAAILVLCAARPWQLPQAFRFLSAPNTMWRVLYQLTVLALAVVLFVSAKLPRGVLAGVFGFAGLIFIVQQSSSVFALFAAGAATPLYALIIFFATVPTIALYLLCSLFVLQKAPFGAAAAVAVATVFCSFAAVLLMLAASVGGSIFALGRLLVQVLPSSLPGLLLPVGLLVWLAGQQRKKPPLHPMPH